MVEAPDPGRGKYKRYRSSRGLRARPRQDPEAGLAELQDATAALPQPDPSRPGKPPRRRWRRRRVRTSRPRWVRWLALLATLAGVWVGLSIVLFLISSLTATGVPASAVAALNGGGLPPFSATTILVMGTDGRPPGLKEPGAAQDSESGGPVRSDTMMLIRTGGGHTSRLSIPRDTLVDLPGYGLQKINAAYYYGGTADGGYTLDLPAGTHHLDGEQALLLAQTRENLCDPAWTDIQREKNQQALLEDIKSQAFSLTGFMHLPWIAWYTPQALETDMNAPTLAAVAASLTMFGTGSTTVLYPTGSGYSPSQGDYLTITPTAIHADVAKFLAG